MILASTDRRLSIFGVGPWLVGLSLVYAIVDIGIRLTWPETMTITLIPAAWQTATNRISAGVRQYRQSLWS